MRILYSRALSTFAIALAAIPFFMYLAKIARQADAGEGSARALYALLLLLIPLLLFAFRAKKSYALVPVSLCLAALLVEAGAQIIVKSPLYQRNLYRYKTEPPCMAFDPEIDFVLTPNASSKASKFFLNGEFVYRNVPYVVDGKGRRATPSPEAVTGAAQLHALFFGCSFTFGMGVPQDATYPARFQEIAGPKIRVLNYGVGGYGTSQMYMQLQRDAFFDDVEPRKGFAVYAFIDDQLNRSVPFLLHRTITFTSRHKFFIPGAGGIQGPLKIQEIPGAWNALQRYKFMNEFSATWLLGAPLAGRYYYSPETTYQVVTELMLRSQKLYLERFDGKFIVLLWPRCVKEGDPLRHMVSRLEESGILVLRPPEMPSTESAQIHPRDSHPSAAEYAWVAQYLYEQLEKNGLTADVPSVR